MELSRDRRMRPSLGIAVALVLVLGLIVPDSAPSAAQESLTVQPAGVVTWDEIVRRDAVQHAAESAPHPVPFMPAPPGREIGAVRGLRSPAAPAAVTPPPTLPQPNGPAIATNFAALGDNNTEIPPDTMGAAGPSHLLTMLNSQVRIQNKGGGIISTVSLASFWTAGTGLAGSPFDPHVVYDALSGRWLVTVFANGNSSTSQVFFAISATSDPTGTWFFYGFRADTGGTTWAEYPGFGVNNTWVPITANMFTVASMPAMPAFVGAKMWVIDKATALSGGTITVSVFAPGFDDIPGCTPPCGFTLKPALTYSAAEPTLYIVDNSGFSSGGTQLVRLSRITGTGPAPAWSVQPGSAFAGTGLFFVANNFDTTQINATQAGTATTVATDDVRASDSVFRNGRLWFAHSGGLPVGAVDRTAVFWYQLDPTAMPTPIVQSGVFDGGAGVHHFFPSITANSADDALIGFSRSDATKFAEAVTAGRFGADAPGTMMGPSVLKAGEGCYVKTFGMTLNRWGDYSATSIDPTDDLTFWTVQEYAATPSPATSCADGSGRWGAWWGTTPAVSPTTTTSSTTRSTTTVTSSSTTSTTLSRCPEVTCPSGTCCPFDNPICITTGGCCKTDCQPNEPNGRCCRANFPVCDTTTSPITCRPVGYLCGNGRVDPGEVCDGSECCASDCNGFKGPTEPCGTETRACHEQHLCNGREPVCPDVERLASEGSTCSNGDECVIGACHQGECQSAIVLCSALAEPRNNGKRNVAIKITCLSNEPDSCDAEAVIGPSSAATPSVSEPRTASRPVCAGITPPSAEEPLTNMRAKKLRRASQTATGLKFKTTVVLHLNARGRALLACEDLHARVNTVINRRDGKRLHPLAQLVGLLKFHR